MNAFLRLRGEIDAGLRAEMLELFRRHFDGVEPARFDQDLDEKSAVVGLRNDDGRLTGFSTFLYYASEIGGEAVYVVYSGDTIVELAAWNEGALARAWIGAVLALHGERPQRLFWLLIASGYRTYRFLPVFFLDFHPRHDRPVPADVREALASLARERCGAAYDEAKGVVRFPDAPSLAGPLRGIPAGRLADPHVAFFARANPGHERGEELVCLTEIAEANLTPAARRVVRSARRGSPE